MVRHDFRSPNPKFWRACTRRALARAGAHASKFSFLKNSRGLKYQYFFVIVSTKLPLTTKNKRRNTNLKFDAFSKLLSKRTFVYLLFQKLKLKKKKLLKKFGDPQKYAFLNFEMKNKIVLKFVFLRLYIMRKGSFIPIFKKKIDI